MLMRVDPAVLSALLNTPVPKPRLGVRPSQLQAYTPQGVANIEAYLAGLELERIATIVRQLRWLLAERAWRHAERHAILDCIDRALYDVDLLKCRRSSALDRSNPCKIR